MKKQKAKNLAHSGTKGIRNKVSEVWKDFTKEEGEDGREWARCHHCNKKFVGSSKSGTTHLRNHLGRCLRKAATVGDQQLRSLPESQDMAASNFTGGNITFDQERSRLDLAKMIIKHKNPLKMFDDELLKIFLKNLQPAFEFPSLDITMVDILHVYREEKGKLWMDLDNLSSRIHLVIYLWKDKPEDGKSFYLFLISRSINDDWELKEKILAVKKLQYDIDAEALFETFKSLISEWHIEKKICFTTVKYNSYTGIDKFTSLLSERLSISCSSTDRSLLMCYVDTLLDLNPSIIECEKASMAYGYLNEIKDVIQSYATGTNYLADICYFKFVRSSTPYILSDILPDIRSVMFKIASYLISERHLLIAALLDPRLKFQMISGLFDEYYGSMSRCYVDDFNDSLDALYGEYKSVFGEVPPSTSHSDDSQTWSELSRYRCENKLPENARLEILDWWRVNTPKFPTLARMARDYLPLPMSPYPVDSAISAEVMRIREVFNDPNPEIVEALICAKDWLENA